MGRTVEDRIFDFELSGVISENARAVLGRDLDRMATEAKHVLFQHPGVDT